MIGLRARYSFASITSETAVLRTNPVRRVLFGAIAVLLSISMAFGLDVSRDFGPGAIGGTLFFLSIWVCCSAVAAWQRLWIFHGPERELTMVTRLLGLVVRRSTVDLTNLEAVVCQKVALITVANRGDSFVGRGMARFAEKRGTMFKVVLQLANHQILIEDGTDGEQLASIAQTIAATVKAVYRTEKL